MTPIKSNGHDPRFARLAEELGRQLAARQIGLVYGGGRVGLMGICADAVLAGGGRVVGIIPRHLQDLEVGHHGLSELKIVDTMHERKRMMFDLSDAFCALPGGLGTLDEFFEIITWRQLGLHDKPVVLVNAEGYWDRLLGLIDEIVDAGFAKPAVRQYFSVAGSIGRLFDFLAEPPETQEPDYPERI
jgi:uncharacterized protein (TIGR00730 family)